MKSIYEIYVPVTSQKQADRLKAICVKYGLPIWHNECAFEFFNGYDTFSCNDDKEFFIREFVPNKTPITESEFELLAKEFKTQ
jgi:hypothetical protein